MSDTLSHQPTVAVITSTIGRSELERAILSVQAQTYPCKHYVFVDGADYAQQAKAILDKFPNVIATYLPMNTGKGGWTNSSINAIAPFLVKEEIICYLDDDNWYDANHIETGVKTLLDTGADYAYSLRKIYDNNANYVCEDTLESIGYYENKIADKLNYNVESSKGGFSMNWRFSKNFHIDTNCYVMKHQTAKMIAVNWHSGASNDTNVLAALNQLKFVGKCTKHISVNYILDVTKYMPAFIENAREKLTLTSEQAAELGYKFLKLLNDRHISENNGKYPWDFD